MKSNLDLVNECDSFPYPSSPGLYHAALSGLYTIVHNNGETSTPIGYLSESVFNRLAKVPISIKGELEVSRAKRTVSIFQHPTEEERSKAVAATAAYWRENKIFRVLDGWRSELYPVYGPGNELLWSVERSASPLFGVVTYGIHMTAFVRDEGASYGLKMWVPRRAKSKQTYSGMLDNTVAGGMATGEEPFECLVREADEEASLPADLVRGRATAHGTVTYIYVREQRAGGESGLVQPEVQYVYDLELPRDVEPKPKDGEVEEFYLWTIEEVQDAMAKGEFKPNCSMLVLDFFIRHGILTPENEQDFEEINRRIHRDLEFPGPHSDSR
ncbi:thiamine pyrophosphokinase-related protein-like protein [Bisporella sp. PMI_857]|nr:thiamine pyrophosphokinase-related protein-like protein [Bisporella sp. PMI_857]